MPQQTGRAVAPAKRGPQYLPMRLPETPDPQQIDDAPQRSARRHRSAPFGIEQGRGKMDAFGETALVVRGHALGRDQMGELERGDQADPEAERTGAGGEVVIAARQQRPAGAVKLDAAGS